MLFKSDITETLLFARLPRRRVGAMVRDRCAHLKFLQWAIAETGRKMYKPA